MAWGVRGAKKVAWVVRGAKEVAWVVRGGRGGGLGSEGGPRRWPGE